MAQKKWLKHLIVVIEIALVMTDLVPIISEPIRFGTLFIVQAVFHNIYLSGLSFGGITLILDILGAISVADLLAKKITAKIIDKTNSTIKYMGMNRLLQKETTTLIDIGITLLVGTPITLILKQRHNPSRTVEDNISLGVFLSSVATIVSFLQGTAIVAGLWHPNALTIALAVLVVGSALLMNRYLRKIFR